MANLFLRIDNKDVRAYTKTLEKMHRSALPGAIRETLSKTALDVKQRTMPVSADKHFENRKENFFKANSKVNFAKGWDVDQMKSTVGFSPSSAKYNNLAVSELQQQEYGGVINKRSYVPTDEARQGKTDSGEVAARYRLRSINEIVFANKQKARSRKQKFLFAAVNAGIGGFVVAGLNKEMLYRIEAIKRDGRKTVVKAKSLYSYRKGRSVRIKHATGFMREASLRSAGNMEKFYIQEANKQFQRLMSK